MHTMTSVRFSVYIDALKKEKAAPKTTSNILVTVY